MSNCIVLLFSQTMEIEQSLLSDHEMKHRADLARAELKKRGEDADLLLKDAGGGASLTARDIEDAYLKEAKAFELGSRKSEADEKNDVTSVQRARDRPLRLIVDHKVGRCGYLFASLL